MYLLFVPIFPTPNIYFLSSSSLHQNISPTIIFFAGIYSCKELDDMKPEQIILYYSQNIS